MRAVKRKISEEVAFPDQNKKQRRQTAKGRFESTLLHEYYASLEPASRDDEGALSYLVDVSLRNILQSFWRRPLYKSSEEDTIPETEMHWVAMLVSLDEYISIGLVYQRVLSQKLESHIHGKTEGSVPTNNKYIVNISKQNNSVCIYMERL